jgi:hypothetical protein
MDRTPVTSSSLAEVGYDPGTMTLEILFKHGGAYQYFDVPEMVHQGLMSSPSKGEFFHASIKDVYRSVRL